MKLIKKILLFFLVVIILSQSASIGLLIYERTTLVSEADSFRASKFEKLNFIENANVRNKPTEYEDILAVEKKPKSVEEVKQSGWIPDWDFQDGFTRVKTAGYKFDSVSPFWFELQNDGNLKVLAPFNNKEFVDYVKTNGVNLVPTITCFDPTVIGGMLNSPQNMQRHIDEIIRYVKEYNFEGIDLDYEAIYLKDKELFFEFMQKLSIEMNNLEKNLVFTVMPKWGDEDVVYSYLAETRNVQDYQRIAELVDEFRIMAYEYTGRNSNYYGPNGPLKWIEFLIQYAIYAGVPREKLMIGIGTYSYDYPTQDALPQINFYPTLKIDSDKAKEPAKAYYNTDVRAIKSQNQYTEEYNEEWGEMVMKYVANGVARTIVYPNERAINERVELMADYGIKGVVYWRLGDE